MADDALAGAVRIVEANEVDLWCACPLKPGDEGYESWLEGERDWVKSWHPQAGNLFAYEADGEWLGKYDVAIPRPGRWTLWAPTVRPGVGAERVMEALCHHVMAEAGRRFIPSLEVLLEGNHTTYPLARQKLLDAGFTIKEERVLVSRDLERPLPPVPTGVLLQPAASIGAAEVRALGRQVGMATEDIQSWEVDAPEAPLGIVAVRAGKPIGLCLAGSKPGDALLHERHIGVCRDVRGQGLATTMFLAWLARGKELGATTFVGSTDKDNAAMLRVFEKVGCRPTGTRLVFRGRPKPGRA